MLPVGGASSRSGGADVPAALARRWHGEADDSYGYSDDADSPLPAWRRDTADERGGGRAFAAVPEPQHPLRHGSPQRRLFGDADGGDEGRPPSHPLAFGSYVQPADGDNQVDQPPPSRPSAWPDAAPDSSPFRPRQVVRFMEPTGDNDGGSSPREPAPWQPPPRLVTTGRPPLAVSTAPPLTDSSGEPLDGSAAGSDGLRGQGAGRGGGAGSGELGYAPPPEPVVLAATPRAGQPSYLRAHLQAAALLAAQRQEQKEERQRSRRSPV
jgi:hypothetical protein